MPKSRFHPMLTGVPVPMAQWMAIALVSSQLFVGGLHAEVSADRFQHVVDEYSQWAAAEQQQWLSDVFRFRSEPACRLMMKPGDVERQVVRQRAVLDRIGDGRQLSTSGLHQLLSEVDEQESQAIAKLQRDFQRAVQETLADDPAEIERRLKSWNDLLSEWERLGRPWEEQPKIILWLQRAIAHQKAFGHGRLPATPVFRTALTSKSETRPAPSPPPSPVDVKELRVRIEGYNLAMTDLLARLHAQEHWRPDQLEAAIDTMEDLAELRVDLELYWNVLPPEARATLKPVESLHSAISLAASKTAAARKQLVQQSGLKSRNDDKTVQLHRLERISRRLAELASEKN